MTKIKEFDPVEAARHGYTREDWDEVSDNPEWTQADFARARPFAEVFPDLHASIQRSLAERDAARLPVTIRLDPGIKEKLEASGPDWETRVNDALRRLVDRAA